MVRWRPYSAIPSRFSNVYMQRSRQPNGGRRTAEATMDKVSIGDDVLENVLNFEYLGSRLQCDGDDQGDVRHRMDIAQTAFGSLSHIIMDWAPSLSGDETAAVQTPRVLVPDPLYIATLLRRYCEGRHLLSRGHTMQWLSIEVDYLHELIDSDEPIRLTRQTDVAGWRDNNSGWSVGLQHFICVVSWDPLGLIWIHIFLYFLLWAECSKLTSTSEINNNYYSNSSTLMWYCVG